MIMLNIKTSEQFYDIINNSNKEYILCDFYADWCGPCKIMMPTLEKMCIKYDYIEFVKLCIDGDESLENIADKYKVLKVPTIMIFKKGNINPIFNQIGTDSQKICNFLDVLNIEQSNDF
jgi:thioredoxin 1